jgi:hypothetical protein
MVGQGVLPIPLVYNGWVQNVSNTAEFEGLTCGQRHPFAIAGVTPPPNASDPAYSPGNDIFRGVATDPSTGATVVVTGEHGIPGTVIRVR